MVMPGSGFAARPCLRIRESLLREIDRAIEGLSRSDPSDKVVHQVRKGLKRARAALRLLREAIGDSTYHQGNRWLRDAARPLTPVRDARVLHKTLTDVAGKAGGLERLVVKLRAALDQAHSQARQELDAPARARLAGLLTEARRLIARHPQRAFKSGGLRRGLQRGLRRACKAYRRARQGTSDDRLHEWRKQTKYFLQELDLVAGDDPARFAKRRKRAAHIAEYLGVDHDLALLTQRLRALGASAPEPAAMQLLRQRIERRRQRLQGKATRLAQRLFVDGDAQRLGHKAERALKNGSLPLRP